MRPRSAARALTLLALAGAAASIAVVTPSAAADSTVCHDAALPRQRTEVNADMTVPQFDPALGTLLEVSVPNQAIHLDTDAVFENTAASASLFSENMNYQVALTSPGGLASPSALSGTIQRVPSQTLAAFDGTLDFAGPSAVAQPTTVRNDAAAPVSATDAPTLAAFTGGGTMPFHVATAISEVFTGGGGNVQFVINTFMAANVTVCYRYAPPVQVAGEAVQQSPVPTPAVPVRAVPRTTG